MPDELHYWMQENGEAIVGGFFALMAFYWLARGAHTAWVPWLEHRKKHHTQLPRTEDER